MENNYKWRLMRVYCVLKINTQKTFRKALAVCRNDFRKIKNRKHTRRMSLDKHDVCYEMFASRLREFFSKKRTPNQTVSLSEESGQIAGEAR